MGRTDKTMTGTKNSPFSNLQLELLKLYARQVPEQDLLEIRTWLTSYFANKAMDETDAIWEQNQWSNDTMKQWLEEDNDST